MHRELYSALFLAQIAVLFQVLECAVYPSIHWSPQNPLFDHGNNILYVLPMSKIHIVCPNPTTIMKKVQSNIDKDNLYQNLWIVSREGYDQCNTDYAQGSRLLLRCITPLMLKYYTLVFQRYSAVSSQVFIPGKEYYFIATSDGSRGSVYSKSGGNCQRNNMKLRIFVCKDAQDPRCNRKLVHTTAKTTTIPSTTQSESTTSSTTTNSTPLHITNSTTTTHAPTEETTWSTTSSTSESTKEVVTWTTEAYSESVMISTLSGPVRSKQRSPLKNEVADLNWTIMIPLVACLFLSLMVNIILFCRLRKRQQEYELDEKEHKINEGAAVKPIEKTTIEPRIDRTWLLCRRSADVTEV